METEHSHPLRPFLTRSGFIKETLKGVVIIGQYGTMICDEHRIRLECYWRKRGRDGYSGGGRILMTNWWIEKFGPNFVKIRSPKGTLILCK